MFKKIPYSLLTYLSVFSHTEFGLYYLEQNIKIEVKSMNVQDENNKVKIFIDNIGYDTGEIAEIFEDWTFNCFHEPRGWLL